MPPLLAPEAALEMMLEALKPLTEQECLPLAQLSGRILAEMPWQSSPHRAS